MTTPPQKRLTLQGLIDRGVINIGANAEFVYNRTHFKCTIDLDPQGSAQFKYVSENGLVVCQKDPSSFIKSVVKLVHGTAPASVSGSNEMVINGKTMQQWKDVPSPAHFNNVNNFNNINNNNYIPPTTNANITPNNVNKQYNNTTPRQDEDGEYIQPVTPRTPTENRAQVLKSLEDLEKSFGGLNLSPKRSSPEKSNVNTSVGEVKIHKKTLSNISASGIGRYFHLNCHRFLAYSTIPKQDRQNKIPYYQAPAASSLQQASIDGGFAWEDYITKHYLGGPENILCPAQQSDPVDLQHKNSVQALKDAKGGNYIAQSVFLPPQTLWRNLPKDVVQFSRSIPDFLHIQQIGQKRRLVILDAKSTSHAKFSQQIQVAFYSLLLSGIIEEEKIADLEVSSMGGIWLKNKREVDYFDITPVRDILEKFLYGSGETDLLKLLSVPKELADWHMMPICEGCDFFDVCHSQAKEDNTLSQAAYISKQTRATLLSFRHSFSSALSTFTPLPLPYSSPDSKTGTEIEDLHQLLVAFQVPLIEKFSVPHTAMNGPVLASLKMSQPRVQAVRNQAVVITGSVNVDFPTVQEDVSVFISFLSNPESNAPYSWAVRVEDSSAGSEFASGSDIFSFVVLLANTFCQVNEANARAGSWGACKSLQCYIFDQYEHTLLIKTLLGLIMDHPEIRNGNLTPSSNPFAKSLVVVLLALLHSSDWLGFGGAAAMPSHAKTMKVPQAKPKPTPSSDFPIKKLDFNELESTGSPGPAEVTSPTNASLPSPPTQPNPSSQSNVILLPWYPLTSTPQPDVPTPALPTPTTPTVPASSATSTSPVPTTPAARTTSPPITPATPITPQVPVTPITPPITPVTTPLTSPLNSPPPQPPKEFWRNLLSCSPAIVVQSLVTTMLAFPYFPVYDITSCAKYILGRQTECPIDAESIFREWKKQKKVEGKVESMLRERLLTLRDIVQGLRNPTIIGEKVKRPRKFALRPRLQVSNSIISQMLFTEEYELASTCSKIRSDRSAPLPVRIQTGKAVKITVMAKNVFAILPQRGNPSATYDSYSIFATLDEIYGKVPQVDFAFTFPWLISQNSIEGEAGIYQFDDGPFQEGIPAELLHGVGFARVDSIEPDSQGYRLKLRVKLRKKSTILKFLLDSQQSDPYAKLDLILHERFIVDMMFPTLHQHALDMDEQCKMGHPPLLLKLITTPTEWLRSLPEAEFGEKFLAEAARVAEEFARTHEDLRMHPSQTLVWQKLVANKLQLVLGPPGTGKTHFLALSILILLETHRSLGIPFTIGVTAFTHIACEHLLAKISSLQRLANLQFSIIKLGEITTKEALEADISAKEPGKNGILPGSLPLYCVVGGTVWRFRKAFSHYGQVLDALIIDEATQLPVLEASIVTQFINESKGRLILAGDHKQLGPIRRGEYPRGNLSSLQLHKSIFVCLKATLSISELKNKHLGTLHENMRMNADLCAFPASQVYTADYKPYRLPSQGPAVERTSTTPRNAPPRSLSNLVTRIVSQERSMVVVLLPSASNVTSMSWESQITALLALELFNESGLPQDSDGHAEFWRKRLFVVTPQHTQRLATRQALIRAGFIGDQLFVDTVEKMQGQEAENVIVSYGSCQWAHVTSEFVFSRNRLNVCTSRAKSRCVVLLLEDLLTPSPAVLDNPSTKKAYYYLLGLVSYAKVFRLGEFL